MTTFLIIFGFFIFSCFFRKETGIALFFGGLILLTIISFIL